MAGNFRLEIIFIDLAKISDYKIAYILLHAKQRSFCCKLLLLNAISHLVCLIKDIINIGTFCYISMKI
ncbi:hypothetical protein GA0061081_102103 [Gilliamella bombicola]|uniref:Uncharacterized protein n=1 Tax=Gilliamella bombicola TaxID=1798182 RepID=A0A1C3ZUZ7_9GAMM|nr:hypothetical protein GA0061081_102103 [Gilliamella bombicola]